MRHRMIIILILFLVLLSGCRDKSNLSTTIITTEMTTTTTLNNTTTTTTEMITTTISEQTTTEQELMSPSKTLNVIDQSPEYIINSEHLATYEYNHDPTISYVNVIEFIDFMDGGIVDLDIKKEDELVITRNSYEMKLDAENEIISYNDFDMVSKLNAPNLTRYVTDLFVASRSIVEGNPSVDIPLSFYDMEIVLFEEDYYIPLYLANLFFTGEYINVYEMNDEIIVFDNFSDKKELIDSFEKNSQLNVSGIELHTKKYLALYFDYFYGLKDFKNIYTYLDVLNNYNFEENDDFSSLHYELERFISSQNDLHTSLISTGYMNLDDQPSRLQNNKYNNYKRAYEMNQCKDRTSEIDYWNYNDLIIIQVNRFNLETRTKLIPVMEEAKNYDDIVIDVSCNPGGHLVAVFELLSYMTNERIPLYYINPVTGDKTTQYYDSRIDKALENKNFYIYTTASSYSAANLFTSIANDLDLATIIGGKSGGGASAIRYTVLPDGAFIVNSSNLTFMNEDSQIIEDGIEVDIQFNGSMKWDLFYRYLNEVNYVTEVNK